MDGMKGDNLRKLRLKKSKIFHENSHISGSSRSFAFSFLDFGSARLSVVPLNPVYILCFSSRGKGKHVVENFWVFVYFFGGCV